LTGLRGKETHPGESRQVISGWRPSCGSQPDLGSGSCLMSAYTFNGGTNRIDGGTYDAAGNYTSGGYVYDADNRLITAPGGYSYVYDAEGRRVAKKTSGTIANEYLLDTSGGQFVELDGLGNVLHTNIFANGQLIATYKNDNQTYFHFNDWLGNRRFQTNAAEDAPRTLARTNYPFADGLNRAADADTQHHFTRTEPVPRASPASREYSSRARRFPHGSTNKDHRHRSHHGSENALDGAAD